MIQRPLQDCRESEIVRITREPMRGKISLSFGLERLSPPPDCHGMGGNGFEAEGKLMGCSLYWHWPTGERYLSGLRFMHDVPVRPTPRFWKKGFESVLEGVSYAWTSIGVDNHQARRVLEHEASWLPKYYPCQKITTWFIPLRRVSRSGSAERTTNDSVAIVKGDFRHVAITAGSGLTYIIGRTLRMLGLPGIPRPGQRIRIAYADVPRDLPPPEACASLKEACASVAEFDGLVITLPGESELAEEWEKRAPARAWKWFSQLYCVSWDRLDSIPAVPGWKGWWL